MEAYLKTADINPDAALVGTGWLNPPGLNRMPYRRDAEGYIGLPPGPGLGVEVDEAKLGAESKKPQTYRWPGAKLKDGSVGDY